MLLYFVRFNELMKFSLHQPSSRAQLALLVETPPSMAALRSAPSIFYDAYHLPTRSLVPFPIPVFLFHLNVR